MSDFARLVKQQRGIAFKAAPTAKPLPSPPRPPPPPPPPQRPKAKTSPKQALPPLPSVAAPRNGLAYVPLRERFDVASDEALAYMRKCRAFDTLFVALWVGMLVLPPVVYSARAHDATLFGESPASAMFLLLLTGAAPLAVSFLRVLASLRLSRALRVDQMANAPKALRQLAYTAHDPALAWWFWCGYVLAPLVAALNVALVLVWWLFVGVGLVLALMIVALSATTAVATVRCTAWFYANGIQTNFNFNVACSQANRTEWAAHCAQEMRNRYFRSQDTDEPEDGLI